MRSVIFLFSAFLAQAAGARGLVVLIPGSASNGDEMYIKNLNPFMPYFGGGRYFGRFEKELADRNLDFLVCPENTAGDTLSLEERAEVCVRQILETRTCGADAERELLLVGHSMGGLIARLLASDARVQNCVQSVTTLSTPQHGTPLADFSVQREQEDRVGFDLFTRVLRYFNYVPSKLRYLAEIQMNREGKDPALFKAQDTPDNPRVKYYSFTDSMPWIPVPPLEATREFVAYEIFRARMGGHFANDGIVPELSMVHGQDMGHLETHHWASACVDTVKDTLQCDVVLDRLMPHLARLYPR